MTNCPMCEDATTEAMVEQTIRYNNGTDLVPVTAIVPVITCNSCEFAFTDYRAEEIRDAAIRKHIAEQR